MSIHLNYRAIKNTVFMDSEALIILLIESVVEEEPLAEVWASDLAERSKIYDILISYISSPFPAPPNSLAELLAFPAVSLVLDSMH